MPYHPGPLPRLTHDYAHDPFGCTIFSNIELVTAEHQIFVHPDDTEKSAATSSFDLVEFPYILEVSAAIRLENTIQR